MFVYSPIYNFLWRHRFIHYSCHWINPLTELIKIIIRINKIYRTRESTIFIIERIINFVNIWSFSIFVSVCWFENNITVVNIFRITAEFTHNSCTSPSTINIILINWIVRVRPSESESVFNFLNLFMFYCHWCNSPEIISKFVNNSVTIFIKQSVILHIDS